MRAYAKPLMQVERFAINEAIANGAGCKHHDASDPDQISVYCIIGSQTEKVFYSCNTSATQHKVIENYGGSDYFIWYTYAGDTSGNTPSAKATAFLKELVEYAGFQSGSGWHYAKVDASGSEAFDTLTIS